MIDKIKTSHIVVALIALCGGLTTLLVSAAWVSWTPEQVATVSGAEGAGIVFVAALVAHFRSGTPSEWVAVMNAGVPLVSAAVGLLLVFGRIDATTAGTIAGVVVALYGAFGITISRSQVYAPESVTTVGESSALSGVALPPSADTVDVQDLPA